MHYLYILFSKSNDTFYVGETYNIDERIVAHNNHYYKNSFTKIANDWECVLAFECDSETQAIYLEAFVKKMKSKIFIRKVIANPNILIDILSKK